ncbi:helix-turn-helix transcriptional regulator [Streptomyces sp. NPDC046332]|uniref:helix-turn-helix domain-containing protein n=1 Tax=unclassified Streptomyces TaxID=2593676 RepID=UPI0033F5384B
MNRDPKMWARLGKAFAHARQAQGLSQAELAEAAGVSIGSVQSAEAGSVPKARMPYTVPVIAKALGWPPGAVEVVLDGGEVPGGWVDTSVQKQVDDERFGEILTNSMVRHVDGATSAEIKAATRAALDALRREGLI